jgi:hypothetical protein
VSSPNLSSSPIRIGSRVGDVAANGAAVPHLTSAERGPVAEMRAAEAAVQRQMPIRPYTQSLTLIIERESSAWDRAATFRLGSR